MLVGQGCKVPLITPRIRIYFVTPEILVGFWPLEHVATMTMPKAPMHENYRPIFRKNDVRLSWEILAMEAERAAD